MVKTILNHIALHGYNTLPPRILWLAARCMAGYRMTRQDVVDLYTKYIGDWGGSATEYRFDAIRDGRVVKTVIKTPMKRASLQVGVYSKTLVEENSYDVTAIRIRAVDENGNLLSYCNEPLKITAEGPVEIIGPDLVSLKGGMAGIYVKTIGSSGNAAVTISNPQLGKAVLSLEIIIQ